jgi:cellulose synthase/poly-beta-1,6-N-acetylglucosamine synthase-like glycosyltransferase
MTESSTGLDGSRRIAAGDVIHPNPAVYENAANRISPPAADPERQPDVSVIVPAYGVAHLLGAALASLQAQHLQNWEAVVIDDGALDDVASAFAPFAPDRRFRLLLTDNQGVAAARNRAIAASKAPFICLLDGDDLYEPSYLDRMLAAIEADPGLGFVCCDALVFGAGERTPRRYSSLYAMSGRISLERVLDRKFIVFVAAIIRRSAMDQIGGFDASLAASEDLDVWIRLLAAGWSGALLPEPLVHYRRRPASLSSSARRIMTGACSVYRKASRSLEGRAEQAVADSMLASCEQAVRWLHGEDLVLRGDIAGGLLLLSGAEQRSLRWRIALAIMRRAPFVAAGLLRARAWVPNLRRKRAAAAAWVRPVTSPAQRGASPQPPAPAHIKR